MAYTLTPTTLQHLTAGDLANGQIELATQARLQNGFSGPFTTTNMAAAAAATASTAHYALRSNETWPQATASFYDHPFNPYASATSADQRRVSPDRTGNTLSLAVVNTLGKYCTINRSYNSFIFYYYLYSLAIFN